MFDLHLPTPAGRRCDGASRRDFLRIGGLSALGIGLGSVLAAQARGEGDGSSSRRVRAKSVILVYLGGGLSHHDTFDMKPEMPEDIRGKYSPIASNVAGLQVGELLPMMAQTMDKVCLVRSGAHNNDHHETATNWVMSGKFGSAFGDHPAIGAVVAHETGFGGSLPPYVAVPKNPSFTWELGRSAYLGGRYESFKAGDPNDANYQVRNLSPADALAEVRADRRRSLLQTIDGLARKVEGSDSLKAYDQFQQKAATMLLSSEARDAFAIKQEKDSLRDRYGRTTFGQSCLLARRLVERGVKFVTVNSGGWDHHGKIFPALERMLPDFDRGFSALVSDLADRGTLDDTLVLCMGEFGRTPKINKDAGRDHWAPAASLLWTGAGVRTGKVIGKTDRDGGQVTDNPIRPADVAFTVLSCLGIDPHKHLRTPDGRPIAILDEGRMLDELFV